MTQRNLVLATIASIAAVAAVMIAIFAWPMTAEHARWQRPVTPPSADAIDRGGVPIQDPAVERAISELARAVTSGGAFERSPPGIAAHGAALVTSWQVMIDAFEQWRGGTAMALDELRHVVRATSEQLATANTGFQLEIRFAKDGDAHVATIIGYRIDEVWFVVANGEPRRVLGLRRADGAKLARGALGIESPEMGPVLMIDPVASYAVTDVLPVLAPGAVFPLGEAGWRSKGDGRRIAALAGEAVRRELAGALATDAEAGSEIAKLVAERDGIVEHWREVPLGPQGLYLPETVKTSRHNDGARVDAIEDELARLQAERIADRLASLVIASVRRHEAQHAFDFDRESPLPYPPALEALAGASEETDGKPRITVTFARAELDAYLSQLINDPLTPHLTLWGVAAFAFSRVTSPESRAGTVILTGLASHLGVARGTGDDMSLATAATACAGASGDQLRTAARALWTELYGEAPVVIVDRPER